MQNLIPPWQQRHLTGSRRGGCHRLNWANVALLQLTNFHRRARNAAACGGTCYCSNVKGKNHPKCSTAFRILGYTGVLYQSYGFLPEPEPGSLKFAATGRESDAGLRPKTAAVVRTRTHSFAWLGSGTDRFFEPDQSSTLLCHMNVSSSEQKVTASTPDWTELSPLPVSLCNYHWKTLKKKKKAHAALQLPVFEQIQD